MIVNKGSNFKSWALSGLPPFSKLLFRLEKKVVWMKNWNLNQGVNQLKIDLSLLPSGFYYFHLPEAHAKKSQLRFVKERD